ncbi:hypothetical protein E2P81_ATG06330 [Venturia nashicola]|uniref:Uncharacterized protein n=1 Tax=Venturia nashicola TaxID=86259 RepID=A0A4Z1PAB5_9PEZI|nr:hypothetical protein E6O75_ATG06482 [Venturia nashicola]TLD27984.1 hypothetical protein E2P81_ATG06330 [Venturia nashicola]
MSRTSERPTYASVLREGPQLEKSKLPNTSNFAGAALVVPPVLDCGYQFAFPRLPPVPYFNFKRLPAEIRNEIYRLALTFTIIHPEDPSWITVHDARARGGRIQNYLYLANQRVPTLGLMTVNRQIHKEAAAFLYKNHLHFEYEFSFGLFLKQIGRNIVLVENIEIEDFNMDEDSAFDGTFGPPKGISKDEVFALLSKANSLRSLKFPKLVFTNGYHTYDVSTRGGYFNGRETARLVFVALRGWIQAMHDERRDWKTPLSLTKHESVRMAFEIFSNRDFENHYNSKDFNDEIARLLENPDGCWMGSLDSEATILWTGYDRADWSPVRERRMNWEQQIEEDRRIGVLLSTTRSLRRYQHLG